MDYYPLGYFVLSELLYKFKAKQYLYYMEVQKLALWPHLGSDVALIMHIFVESDPLPSNQWYQSRAESLQTTKPRTNVHVFPMVKEVINQGKCHTSAHFDKFAIT